MPATIPFDTAIQILVVVCCVVVFPLGVFTGAFLCWLGWAPWRDEPETEPMRDHLVINGRTYFQPGSGAGDHG